MRNPAHGALAVLCVVAGLSGCSASRAPEAASTPTPSSTSAPIACTPSNLTVMPDGAFKEGMGSSAVGVWLRLGTKSDAPCRFAKRPSVVIDSGYGPDPAINGTTEPDLSVVSGALVSAPTGLRLLLSWTSECDPNHKAPIVELKIGPEGDEHLTLAANRLPASLGRTYCWNDGVELGTKGY